MQFGIIKHDNFFQRLPKSQFVIFEKINERFLFQVTLENSFHELIKNVSEKNETGVFHSYAKFIIRQSAVIALKIIHSNSVIGSSVRNAALLQLFSKPWKDLKPCLTVCHLFNNESSMSALHYLSSKNTFVKTAFLSANQNKEMF